jgi:hypothetical protein
MRVLSFFYPLPAEFLAQPLFLELSIINKGGYQDENFNLVSQQYRVIMSDCTVQCVGWPGSILVTKGSYFKS